MTPKDRGLILLAMSFSAQIKRRPIAFQAEIAQDMAGRFSALPDPLRDLLAGSAGCSPYLAGLMTQEADWIAGLADASAEELCREALAAIAKLELSGMASGFRQAKRRLALLTALADLGGVWPLETVTQALTDLADVTLDTGLKSLVAAEIARGKLPGKAPEDASTAAGMCILAMGKMGAGELNYSSDVDLICLFDETQYDPDDYHAARAAFVRITRRLMQLMSDRTEDGYVFRTDLRLRPDASVTPVCIPMETAERYYESVGRTWERAAFIKARPCAGDLAAGEAFLTRLAPFIWRKHLDFASIQDAHDMRLRIRDHKGLHGALDLDGHNMKLGLGGIREIEFFTQTRQIIAGGRDPKLRVRGTLEGLAVLSKAGWIEPEVAEELTTAYRAHREVEHRLQMIGDAQTHDLPNNTEGFDRLARFMGEDDTEAMKATLSARLTAVSTLTEAFFAPGEADQGHADTAKYLEKWRGFPALRSERAVAIFERLFPEILTRLQAASKPDEALSEFERFLSGLPAGVQVFSLFEATPQLQQLIVDICTTSPALAAYLSRNSAVLDAVIAGDFFSEWPGADGLHDELAAALMAASDYEAQLDTARRWQKDWHFRIGVHHLRGLISPEVAGSQYADLAQAVIRALFACVEAEFARKHGTAPGRGAAILGMGSLGVGRLSARSDLDLIVIYDAAGVESSDGSRPLAVPSYFARLTQALITGLTVATAEGRLYEVDMRLRPSGQSGPVATSLSAFESYQKSEAWVWEHLALTRARAIAGGAGILDDIERIRREVLKTSHTPERIATDTAEMRDRLAEAGRTGQGWDVKEGPGGQRDIELLAQAAALIAGLPARGTTEQIEAGVTLNWYSQQDADALNTAHSNFWRLQQSVRLLTEHPLNIEELGRGATEMLLRDCDAASLDDLTARLVQCRKQASKVIDQALSQAPNPAKGEAMNGKK